MNCLKCKECKLILSDKQFVKQKNGNIVCESCNAKLGPKCQKCKQTFEPGEKYKKLKEKLCYHNKCFICSGSCHKPIGAEFYEIKNDKYLCVECYDKHVSSS
jgi:hypothetical protein